jgi:hypothetical protein
VFLDTDESNPNHLDFWPLCRFCRDVLRAVTFPMQAVTRSKGTKKTSLGRQCLRLGVARISWQFYEPHPV